MDTKVIINLLDKDMKGDPEIIGMIETEIKKLQNVGWKICSNVVMTMRENTHNNEYFKQVIQLFRKEDYHNGRQDLCVSHTGV